MKRIHQFWEPFEKPIFERNPRKALQALTPYGPGAFTEEACVSFMASYKPYERSRRAIPLRALRALPALRSYEP